MRRCEHVSYCPSFFPRKQKRFFKKARNNTTKRGQKGKGKDKTKDEGQGKIKSISPATPIDTVMNGTNNNASNNTRRRRATPSRRRATIMCGGEDISDILNGSQSVAPSRRTSILPGSFKRPRDFEEDFPPNVGEAAENDDVLEAIPTDPDSTGDTPIPVKMAREEAMFNAEEEELRLSVYKELEESLERKIKAQRAEAVRLKETNREEAMKALRKGKALREKLAMLIAAKNHPSKPYPPEYRRVKRKAKKLIRFPDIPDNKLQVTVNGVEGLSFQGKGVLNTYLYSQFRFSEGLPLITIRSPPVSGSSNPAYKYTTYIPIERRKCYEKYFERKKIVFSVYQKRPFFLPDVLLAKFDVPLAGLVRRAENEIICPLYQQGVKRSEQDSNASVTVRLQVPLVGDDVRFVDVEDIEIVGEIVVPKDNDEKVPDSTNDLSDVKRRLDSSEGGFNPEPNDENGKIDINSMENNDKMPLETESVFINENNAVETALPQQNELSFSENMNFESENIPANEPKAVESSAPQKNSLSSVSSDDGNLSLSSSASSKEEGSSQDNDVEALRKEARNVKRYNSTELSDMEIQRIDNEIKRLRGMNKEVPQELEIRRGLIENQSTILVVLVQNGRLTIEQYIQQLNEMLAADEALLEKLRKIPALKVEMNMTVSRIAALKREIQSGQEE